MKRFIKILVLTPFLFCMTSLENAGNIQWQDFTDGYTKAIELNKPAMIDCYTDWCGYCKKMDKTTFQDSAVMAKLKSDFISIKFNPEKKQTYVIGGDTLTGRQLLGAISNNKPSGYPTFYFFIPQTKQMFQYPGYQPAAAFKELLDNISTYSVNKGKSTP